MDICAFHESTNVYSAVPLYYRGISRHLEHTYIHKDKHLTILQ